MKHRNRGSGPLWEPSRSGLDIEWIGGCIKPPIFITDREEPYRPSLVVWMELPSGLVVGQSLAPEVKEGDVGRTLVEAMKEPLVGPPRRPRRIRVADPSFVQEIQKAVGEGARIEVAPTPELNDLLDTMISALAGESEASYLAGGGVPPAVVARLFAASKALFPLAVWDVVSESQVLRLDIPSLGVEGACISIIGAMGQSLGFLIFPSLAGYEAFLSAAEKPEPAGARRDFGSGWLSLSFVRGERMAASMRQEAADHGWPLPAEDTYPDVTRVEPDGACPPLSQRDVEIATACAESLPAFVFRHKGLFEALDLEVGDLEVDDDVPMDARPVCESLFDEESREVRFTFPYEAFPMFDVAPPRIRPARKPKLKVARNAPCPCGSGRKYKKCHLPIDESGQAAAQADPTSALDDRMIPELFKFAKKSFGRNWILFQEEFKDPETAAPLAIPWALYHFRVEGRTLLETYLDAHGRDRTEKELSWLAAQGAAWLSVWEVTSVVPGEGLTLEDLLTGETRRVRERTASQTLRPRDAVLARIVDHEGISTLCGFYPRALPPFEADKVVRRAKARLRRKGSVPPARLREEAIGRLLIESWEDAVEEMVERASIPPVLSNTDGDPLLFTTDHYEVEAGALGKVRSRLAEFPDVDLPQSGEDEDYVFTRPGTPTGSPEGNTVIGRARLTGGALKLETNSVKRADALRARVESACGGLIRRRAREHADAFSAGAPGRKTASPPPEPPPEARRLILEFKKRHYADWADVPLPALGGMTPRQAVRTAAGRDAVDLLLKDMEHSEQRAGAPEERFDFTPVRRELGLEDG